MLALAVCITILGFCGAGGGIQGFMHARLALYHLSHIPSPISLSFSPPLPLSLLSLLLPPPPLLFLGLELATLFRPEFSLYVGLLTPLSIFIYLQAVLRLRLKRRKKNPC